MGDFWVNFYKSNTKQPIHQFLENCPTSVARKVARQISYIKEYGLKKEVLDLKKLQGYPLWEIRILGKDNVRILCFQKNEVIYILHIFAKKTAKTQEKEILIGLNRQKEILDR